MSSWFNNYSYNVIIEIDILTLFYETNKIC